MSLKPPKKSDLDKGWMKARRDKPKKNPAGISPDCYGRNRYRAGLFWCHEGYHQQCLSRPYPTQYPRSR